MSTTLKDTDHERNIVPIESTLNATHLDRSPPDVNLSTAPAQDQDEDALSESESEEDDEEYSSRKWKP
jgi:hypothetical protein